MAERRSQVGHGGIKLLGLLSFYFFYFLGGREAAPLPEQRPGIPGIAHDP